MNGCESFDADLGAYHDGELDAARARALETHLPGCGSCRTALEHLAALDASLEALPAPSASPQFEARLWARLARAEEAPPRLWRRLLAPRPFLLAGAASAGALVLYLALPLGPASEEPPVVADAETFELLLEGDLELLSSLEVLEAWEPAEGA